MNNTKKIIGYRCEICKHIWSKLEADCARFDLCTCGNIFNDTIIGVSLVER